MAFYEGLFRVLGLEEWCGTGASDAPLSMADLLAQSAGDGAGSGPAFPFPSLDNLNESCGNFAQTRDLTKGLEDAFLSAKDSIKAVLDPITQPLSWLLDGALWMFAVIPWFIMIPILVAIAWWASRSIAVTVFVTFAILLLAFVDHYAVAMQTLSIIFVCTTLRYRDYSLRHRACDPFDGPWHSIGRQRRDRGGQCVWHVV